MSLENSHGLTPEQHKAYESFCAVLEHLDGAELQDDMFVEDEYE